MDRPAAPAPWEAFLPAAILLAPLLAFLTHHDYRLWRPGAALWILGTVAVGVLLGLAARRGPAPVRILILAACITFALDLQLDGAHLLGMRKLALAAAGTLVLLWLLRAHIAPILGVVLVTLLVSILLLPDRIPAVRVSGGAAGGDESRPPLIVLFLDEHIGIEGIPLDVPGGVETRDHLLQVYEAHGFRIHSRAYSQYFDTYNAIPNLLNFAARSEDNAWFDHPGEPRQLRRDAFLEWAHREGYAVRIYQSDYLDMCAAEGISPEMCLTYRRNSVGTVQDLEMPAIEKMALIGNSFLYRSGLVFRAKRAYNALVDHGLPLPRMHEGIRRVGPLPAGAAMEQMQADLLAAPRGRLFLAHLMAPHYPYAYDAACRLKPEISSWMRRNNDALSAESPLGNTPDSRRRRYREYLAQVRCVVDRLDRFLDELGAAGVLQDATVIVQGDHGSRITRADPTADRLATLSASDLVDGFSSLFAVRAPGVVPGIEERPVPLVRAFAAALGRDAPAPGTDALLLVTKGARPLTPVPMPPF